jgi:hypothetical protein
MLNKDLAHIMSMWNSNQNPVFRFHCQPFDTSSSGALSDYALIKLTLAVKTGDDMYSTLNTSGEYDVIPKFTVSAQSSKRSILYGKPGYTTENENARSYGWTCSFHEPYMVELADARLIMRFLKAITREMSMLSARFGDPSNFGQYVCRIMDALGIKIGVFHYTNDPTYNAEPGNPFYNTGYQHRHFGQAEFGRRINQVLDVWSENMFAALSAANIDQ